MFLSKREIKDRRWRKFLIGLQAFIIVLLSMLVFLVLLYIDNLA